MSKLTRRLSYTVGASALTVYLVCKNPTALVVTAADTDVPCCVVQDGADASGTVIGVEFGPTKFVASAAIARGARLASAGSGKVKTAASGDLVIGTAEQAAAADGDIFEGFFNPDSVVLA